MKISAITTCYNSAATIGYTIESFLRQTHADKEMIVVDGASRDDTLRIVESFAAPEIFVRSEPDTGIYDAMNKGLGRFTGDAVGFLNSDDRYARTDTLSLIAEHLEDAELVFGDLDFVDDHKQSTVVRRWRDTLQGRGDFRSGWMPAHPTFYARRSVVEATGLFDTRLRISADYDYMLRAMTRGTPRYRHIDQVLIEMMAGGTSNSGVKAYVKSNLEALSSRRKWLGTGLVDYALFAKPLRKVGQFMVGARPAVQVSETA